MNCKGLVSYKDEQGIFHREVRSFDDSFLPEGEVCMRVRYSSLNYKDALSAFGKNSVTRAYPHITGIDAAGEIISDQTNTFKKGEEALVYGFDLGMNTFGGHATHIRVPASWVLKKPEGISLKESMSIGTAGVSAGLAWLKMQPYIDVIHKGETLITGASGGVGSIAIALLSLEGANVTACSSKKEKHASLLKLGASRVVSPTEILISKDKFLSRPQWSGAIDNLGGEYLSSILAAAHKEAPIVSVGLASSMELHTSVLPFILNGVNLLGVNSANTPMATREKVWNIFIKHKEKLMEKIAPNVEEATLEELPKKMKAMLDGQLSGRVLVNIE